MASKLFLDTKNFSYKGWKLYTRKIILKTSEAMGAMYAFTQQGLTVPDKLQDKRFRFLEIRPGTKKPKEDDWNITYNYKYDDPEFVDYLKTAKSYGIACRYGYLAIVDCDTKDVASDIRLKLPDTLIVKTGKEDGLHFYFIIKNLKDKIVMTDDNNVHHGEVQWKGQQCIAPGSLHPSGKLYTVVNDVKIAEITEEELNDVIAPYVKGKKVNNFKGCKYPIEKVIDLNDFKSLGNRQGEYQGANPILGSETGHNLNVNIETNLWHDWRNEDIGGDTLSWIAIKHSIISYEDYVQLREEGKSLTGRRYVAILKIAREEYGFDIPERHMLPLLFIDKRLNVEGIVDYIKETEDFITIEDETGKKPHVYIYQDGYYKTNGKIELDKIIKEVLCGTKWSIHNRNEVTEYIKTENVVSRDKIHPPAHLVNVKNGVYNINTKKLEPHDKKYYFLYKIPINYNPNAKMPKIDKFLEDVLKPEFTTLMQEVFGHCLSYNYLIHSVFYLYGLGGSGKSVCLYLLNSLLGGKENVSNKSLHKLASDRFTIAHLYGKLANICGELSPKTVKETDFAKRLFSGETVEAEFKGLDGFDFPNKAKIITACNEMFYSTDKTTGWLDKQYVIPFFNSFRGEKNENIHLKYELTRDKAEMEGLLLWSLQGLHRLLKNSKFTYPGDHIETYQKCIRPEYKFVDTCLIQTGKYDDYEEFSKIEKESIKWCNKNNVPIISSGMLSRALTYRKLTTDVKKINGKSIRIRRYCKFNST